MKTIFPAILLIAATGCLPVGAATLVWDPSSSASTANGAAGAWDTASSQWYNAASGTDGAWSSSASNADIAKFVDNTTTSYAVTIGSGTTLYAGGLSFQANSSGGYTLGASTSNIYLNSGTIDMTGVSNNGTVTHIASVLQGTSGLAITGFSASSTRLFLDTAATYTGATSFSKVTVSINFTANVLPASTSFSMTSATYLLNKRSQSVDSLAGDANSTINNAGASSVSTLTVGSGTTTASTTYAGSLTDTSTTAALALSVGGGRLALTNATGLTYHGATTVSGGALNLGASLTNTASVTVSGGTLLSSISNVTLGTGLVKMTSGGITPGGVGTVGTLTLAANQNFTTTGGTLNFDLGTALGKDQIAGSGTGVFSLANTTLSLNLLSDFDYNSTYAILNGFTSGTVSNLTITGYDTTDYLATLGSGGVLSFSALAVPEPGTNLTLAAGVLALLGGALRRRAIQA
ncbi:MAG TPA: hypothetical protein VIM58_07520 [Candidatus Methylacidiphilales bacterium]